MASVSGGALAVLAVGIDHIEQFYVAGYSTVPTMGTLFVLGFAASVPIQLGLLAAARHMTGRFTEALVTLFAPSAIGLGAGKRWPVWR